MKVPIPYDWTGEFAHYCIAWPDSTNWRGILSGLLSYPMRGRFWDERTGSIKAVQDTAWQIWLANEYLQACVDCAPDAPGCPQTGVQGGALIMGDDDMGQVVTDVTIENGVLTVWFGPCCSRALSDFQAGSIASTLPDEPLKPPGGDAPVYSACGKATAVVAAVWAVLDSTWKGYNHCFLRPGNGFTMWSSSGFQP